MPRVTRPITMCAHVDRKHRSGGYCAKCYRAAYDALRATDPIARAKMRARAAEYQARRYAANPEPQRAKMRALTARRAAARAAKALTP